MRQIPERSHMLSQFEEYIRQTGHSSAVLRRLRDVLSLAQ